MKILRKLRIPLLVLTLGCVSLAFWGCAGLSDPRYFDEAPLPQGWPELTPVGEIEVNAYPAYRAAIVTAGDGRTQASDSGMFRPLFNHIQREDIAMTAPVEMTYNDAGQPTSMAFLYRHTEQGTVGVDANDQRVSVNNLPPQHAVSIGVRGRYNSDRFDDAVQELSAWLAEQDQWQADGEPRFLGYNSPFVPGLMRYGEVQIPVRAAE